MKALLAASITLGMLVFPYMTLPSTAQTSSAQINTAQSGRVNNTLRTPAEINKPTPTWGLNHAQEPAITSRGIEYTAVDASLQPGTDPNIKPANALQTHFYIWNGPNETPVSYPVSQNTYNETQVSYPSSGVDGNSRIQIYDQDGHPLSPYAGVDSGSDASINDIPISTLTSADCIDGDCSSQMDSDYPMETDTSLDTTTDTTSDIEHPVSQQTTTYATDNATDVNAGSPMVIPYGEDGLPVKAASSSGAISSNMSGITGEIPVGITAVTTCFDGTCATVIPFTQERPVSLPSGSMNSDESMIYSEIPVSSTINQACTGANCAAMASLGNGVSSETFEQMTAYSVERMDPMSDGGVMVTYSSEFRPGETLVIGQDNVPHLMTRDTSGNLVADTNYNVAVHSDGKEIILVNKAVNIADLQDDPMPTSTFTENSDGSTTALSANTPLVATDFGKALPASMGIASLPAQQTTVSQSTQGNVTETEVSLPTNGQILQQPGEIPVGYTTSLPAGWRGIVLGNGLIILDDRGVMQNVIPAGSVLR